MNILYIINIFIIICNCKFHFIRKNVQLDPSVLDTIQNQKEIKVALIGFYLFKNELTKSEGRTRVYTASLDYNNSTKGYFKYGSPIENFSTNGIDEEIELEKVNEVVLRYLKNVQISGTLEIVKFAELKMDGSKLNSKLRKRDVNYYIFGVHGPPFQKNGLKNFFKIGLTFFPSFFTLGIIPVWSEYETESIFWIYDNKLNLIKTLHYSDAQEYLFTIFGDEEEFVVKSFYKSHIDRLINEFYQSISSNEKHTIQ